MPPAPSVGKDSYTRSNTSRSCDGTITISNVNERVTHFVGNITWLLQNIRGLSSYCGCFGKPGNYFSWNYTSYRI
ncbi:predicted protein [Sclerotinia sclerotiorum 1980 UF-70]|uniref:Uncharacterized protein n=1 Tax=Sclerotinia sclerotiorum (strain ATCC 18683 / 1980 / Ss-1) TaxID=665079 RepID=A7F1Q0_SCLS1|nr:predicted protein [Sclerotinia sclerotiorum 1980 UF-70]EDN95642.1 predicted protein [Sclerotinia sclerotiorum 1980 UF-70]